MPVLLDEVLTGLWRTGTPLASHHWDGCEPDLVILSKGLGIGYTAVGAVLVLPEIAPLLRHKDADPLPAMGCWPAPACRRMWCSAVCSSVARERRAHLRWPQPARRPQGLGTDTCAWTGAPSRPAGPVHPGRPGPPAQRR
ncbi:aminotransferase class III-fold pyridoxal phosphate-dependent enzyme [Streptomyces sp. NRRL F-2664]|uniref:aminotransferase class III-fold pyridoxal phosphate-dependent enzyme n=1 Tax=Streptomyces sp. NRRL F-2664 TaxID=1463842 RepID=UPI00131D656F